MTHTIAFGPIMSRRFGRSLGVNHLPYKHCSYSCVYCQIGPTPHTSTARLRFFDPATITAAVEKKVRECEQRGETIDVISFVPDGEPTLDANLGWEIREVKRLGLPVAVITNGASLWVDEVREDLAAADIVSIEIDSVDETTWRRVDRPAVALSLPFVLEGMRTFARGFAGALWTQTMLIHERNDGPQQVDDVAAFVAELRPARACISVPTRPPTDTRIQPPDEATLLRAWTIFSARVPYVEMLAQIATEGFAPTSGSESDLVAALAVHPMPEAAVRQDLERIGVSAALVDRLVADRRLERVDYSGRIFLAARRS